MQDNNLRRTLTTGLKVLYKAEAILDVIGANMPNMQESTQESGQDQPNK
jgi:hypothetical protein